MDNSNSSDMNHTGKVLLIYTGGTIGMGRNALTKALEPLNFNHLISNMNQFRKLLKPKTKLCTVIKANAYGHGLIPIANAVLANNSDYLAVAILNEGIKLRQAGITKPILILGFVPPSAVSSYRGAPESTMYSIESSE